MKQRLHQVQGNLEEREEHCRRAEEEMVGARTNAEIIQKELYQMKGMLHQVELTLIRECCRRKQKNLQQE